MRIFYVLCFFCMVPMVKAQTILTKEQAIGFVQNKIHELNMRLWNAAMAEQITLYTNDSLTRKMTKKMLLEKSPQGGTPPLATSDNLDFSHDFDKEKSKKYTVFNPKTDMKGLSLFYKRSLMDQVVQFELVAIAPLWNPFAHGINLGIHDMYFVTIEDVKKLMGDEYPLYAALFNIRASIGDFISPYLHPFTDEKQIANELTYNNLRINESRHSLRIEPFQDSILGYHLSSLPIELARIMRVQGIPLYTDHKLINVLAEKQKPGTNTRKIRAEHFDDLYKKNLEMSSDDLIDSPVKIYKSSTDYVFGITSMEATMEQIGENIVTRPMTLFYSLSQNQQLLSTQDLVVLQTLLRELK